jgi:DNA-directed RNA polymerase alpha subunit
MSHCPDCAKLRRQLNELTRRNDTCTNALSEIKFAATNALTQTWIMSRSIDTLELTVRTSNVLRGVGITTVRDLATLRVSELKNFHGLGRRAIAEIQEALSNYKLGLQP